MDVDGMTRFLNLPSCLVIDILLRLPLKALLTCRCVCKDWIRLFSDPSFIKLHLAASPIHILEQFLHPEVRILNFRQVMEDKCTGNLEETTVKFRTKLNLPSSTSGYWCINSCNGLLCLMDVSFLYDSRFTREKPSVCVCNPILGECVSISVRDRNYSYFSLALVFSAKNNQYKVLHGFETEDYGFEIYTLGGTRQWRSIDETLGCRVWKGPLDFNTFLHGSLHWINYTYVGNKKEHLKERICCFDVDNEKFRWLSLPRPEREAFLTPHVQLGAINGCLCAFVFTFILTDDAEIWAMKEYGVEKSWTMMLAISSVFIRDAPEIMTYYGALKDPVLLFSLNEEEILVGDSREGLICYNTKRKRLRLGKMLQRPTYIFDCVTAYNPSFVSLQEVAKGEQVMLSRYSWWRRKWESWLPASLRLPS